MPAKTRSYHTGYGRSFLFWMGCGQLACMVGIVLAITFGAI